MDTGKCNFCDTEEEDLEHLFFSCNIVQSFWQDIQIWLQSKGIHLGTFTVDEIKFGISGYDKNIEYGINNLLILGKQFIHKCRFFKSKPNATHWRNELKLFTKSLKIIEQKNALNLENFIMVFDLLQ